MRLRELDERLLPVAARLLQHGLDRFRPRRRRARPGGAPGPAPFVLRLRALDDRWARRGLFGLFRDVPQLGALLLALVVFVAGVTVAQRSGAPEGPAGDGAPPPANGQTLVGPTVGDDVAAYVGSARARFQQLEAGEPDGEAVAVVSFDRYLAVADARAAVEVPGLTLVYVSLRVPPPPPQAEIRGGYVDGFPAVERYLRDEAAALEADAAELRRVAATIENDPAQKEYNEDTAARQLLEARQLRRGCACLFGVVVRGKLRRLAELAGRPGVRLVDAAALQGELAAFTFRALLPEERVTVTDVNVDAG